MPTRSYRQAKIFLHAENEGSSRETSPQRVAFIGACIYFERTMVSSHPPKKEDHKPTQTKTNKYMSIHTYVKYFNMYKKFCGKKKLYLRLRLQF